MESILVAGYDSRPNGQVNEYFEVDFILDNYCLRTYFVCCDTGRHDLLIGRKLLEDAGVWVNCKERAICWSDSDKLMDCKRDVQVPVRTGKPDPAEKEAYQADANQRNVLLSVSVF